MTTAALRLRGRHGPLRAEVTWPDGKPEAIVVCVGDGEPDEPHAVVVRVRCDTAEDARLAVEWTRAHAAQLGVPSGRVIVRESVNEDPADRIPPTRSWTEPGAARLRRESRRISE